MTTDINNSGTYDFIRENRMAIYSKRGRYFNREGNLLSALKFLFLVEVVIFMLLAMSAGNSFAQEAVAKNLLHTEYSFDSGISNYSTVYNSGKVFLNWSARNETADCVYIIERSVDGRTFESVGVKEGIGTSVELFYSWMDKEPLEGFSYYRIKKITRDGTRFYSAINPVINQGGAPKDASKYASNEDD